MSNVQITKRCENATTGIFYVNYPPLIHKEVSLLFERALTIVFVPKKITRKGENMKIHEVCHFCMICVV